MPTLLRLLLALVLALAVAVAPAHAQAPVPAEGEVVRVSVVGTRRVEEATALAAISTRRGDTLTPEKVRRDLKSVYATGFFDDVRVEILEEGDGVAVVFTVVEKPAVREVKLVGPKKIDEDDIREVIDIRSFSVLNDADVKANVERIRDLYLEKGYYLVDIRPEVVRYTEDQVELIFHIEENRKVVVQRVDFTGNENVPDSKLRRFMQTKSGGIAPWLTSRGSFQQELLEQDVYTLKYVMMEEGYVDAEIAPPQVYLSPDKRFIFVSIAIDEGLRYDIGEVSVAGDFVEEEGLTREAVLDIVAGRPVADVQDEQWRAHTDRRRPPFSFETKTDAVETGDVFKYTTLTTVVDNIATLYQDQGYAFVNVVPLPDTDPETQKVDITFSIDRGEKVRIGRINITGNDPTFDKVVRREILIDEDDVYRGSLIKASRLRLQRLGYFEDVSMSTPRGEGDDVLDLNVSVSEQPTGSFSLGLGYSNLESIVLTGNVSKNNFLGLGYTMSAAVNWSRLRKQWNLSFFDPYFLDTRWSFSIEGYNITRQYQLDEFQRGGSMGIGRYLDRRDDIRVSLDYTFEDVGLTALAPTRKRMLGGELYRNGFTSSLGVSITVDKRNNRIKPTKGFYTSASIELAGGFRIGKDATLSLLGGDFNFGQTRFNLRIFQPLIPGKDTLVFRFNTTLGQIWSTDGRVIPFIHRFRAGGINSVRGYNWFSLGPTIRSLDNDDPIRADEELIVGGTETWINNFEIEIPIIKGAGLSAAVFFDAGNAFGDPWGKGHIDPLGLRTAYGAEIRWTSPIGPLRFAYGIPINPREGEKKSVFDFSIGSFF